MSKIGIGIVTYNRQSRLKTCVEAVKRHTGKEHRLVVADDGSTDGTLEYCKSAGLHVVSGTNKGVCWNKNRVLFALEALGCDPILLVEDDCYPTEDGWEFEWRIATALYGHVSYAHPKLQPWALSGSGRATDPIVNFKCTAQCSSISGEVLRRVGFLDTRFAGYGVGHAEWTTRIKAVGAGFKRVVLSDGRRARANLYIHGGIRADDAPSFKDRENVARNEKLFKEIKHEAPYRHPWRAEAERDEFLQEQAVAGIDGQQYVEAFCSDASSTAFPQLLYSPSTRKAVRRVLEDERSFVLKDHWLATIATNTSVFEGEIVPWFNFAAIALLKERVKSHWRVFEFGAGYSTVWWSKHVTEVISVESDAHWLRLVGKVAESNSKIIFCADEKSFPGQIDEVEGLFNVVVVDGLSREESAMRSRMRLTEDGIIIFDNSNRPPYENTLNAIKAEGFKELRLSGVAPMTMARHSTSILYRAGNCLDL